MADFPGDPLAAGWAPIRAQAVLEDEAVLVLNKPPGISVMGERRESDLVRLAAQAGEELFPVHRIDKVTSGAVLLAKELRWHGGLTRQFSKRTAGKAYLAVVRSAGLPASGRIDLPLAPGRKGRIRVAAPRAAIERAAGAGQAGAEWSAPEREVFRHVRVYPSVTEFATLWQDGAHAVLVVWPVTGRRHQIRVHLAWTGHPVEGDPLFGMAGQPRTLLHSWRLEFAAAWRGGARLAAEAPPGAGFWAAVASGLPAGGPASVLGRARALDAERCGAGQGRGAGRGPGRAPRRGREGAGAGQAG